MIYVSINTLPFTTHGSISNTSCLYDHLSYEAIIVWPYFWHSTADSFQVPLVPLPFLSLIYISWEASQLLLPLALEEVQMNQALSSVQLHLLTIIKTNQSPFLALSSLFNTYLGASLFLLRKPHCVSNNISYTLLVWCHQSQYTN